MGVNKLFDIFKNKNITNILNHKDVIYGIDMFCWLHKSLFCLQNLKISGIPEADLKNFETSNAFMYFIKSRIKFLKDNSIKFICVFDGKPIKLKYRKFNDTKLINGPYKLDEDANIFQKAKYKKILISKIKISDFHVNTCKKFLDLFGIYIFYLTCNAGFRHKIHMCTLRS